MQTESICIHNTVVPSGPYNIPSMVEVNDSSTICGYFPLNKKNYWVYRDSFFTDQRQFLYTQIDTLTFEKTFKSNDGLIWWEPKSTHKDNHVYRGLWRRIYSTDSTVYNITDGYANRWFAATIIDTVREDCRTSDVSTNCISIKEKSPLTTPAGTFSNVMLFKKEWLLQSFDYSIYYKPGVGILKSQWSPSFFVKPTFTLNPLYATSILISYHLE